MIVRIYGATGEGKTTVGLLIQRALHAEGIDVTMANDIENRSVVAGRLAECVDAVVRSGAKVVIDETTVQPYEHLTIR